MIYFRDKELEKLDEFLNSNKKALSIYGRRRTGKTQLILEAMRRNENRRIIYYQCTAYDYNTCLGDFLTTVSSFFPDDSIITSLKSFRDLFTYLSRTNAPVDAIVIDEFPFLAKRNDNVPAEFQWIIDHGLGNLRLILLGSNLSFMKKQINDREAPLYGRFDEIIEVRPFTFSELNSLFPDFEDAVNVYAQTGGVAQYVMFYKGYNSVHEAQTALFFDRNGRLFQEANNTLLQEVRDTSTYVLILRAIGGSEKDSGQIASKCGIDQRGVYAYLNKLLDLEIITEVNNPLSEKKKDRRYRISDLLFRFNYTFIEPNASMITAIGEKAEPYVLGTKYSEYLGFVYEDIIRSAMYEYALSGKIPFMPETVGKWWGSVCEGGSWSEGEIDIAAFDSKNIILGECKFRTKAAGMKELDSLKLKAQFVPVNGRRVYYLIASKSGFTADLQATAEDLILIK